MSSVDRPDEGSADDEPGPVLITAAPGLVAHPDRPRMRSRWIVSPQVDGWPDLALSEWELTAAGWSDHHPHSETNVVVEGELYVESGDVTVVARQGDTVVVPAGRTGRYWAPATPA
jgi:mannose-6-phosphate isomerase-like protein (cupin superfamily)